MKSVSIEYFAILREQAGMSSELIETGATVVAELFTELQARHEFAAPDNFKVAINDEFADWDSAVNDGDRVVFIPPVAGG